MPLSACVDSRGGKIKCEEVSVFLSYVAGFGGFDFDISAGPVSYTHLTLPTMAVV